MPDLETLSLDILTPSMKADTEPEAEREPVPAEPSRAKIQPGTKESREQAMAEISEVLMPPEEEPGEAPAAEPAKPKAAAKSEPEVVQPVVHEPRLIYLASKYNITPDEAARFPTSRALLAEIALRETEWQRTGQVKDKEPAPEEQEPKKDELELPKFEFDEEQDPKVTEAIQAVAEFAKRAKEAYDSKVAALEAAVGELRTEQEQAVAAQVREQETKIAQMFDEKVAEWGPEFTEILGVPQKTWQQPGTKQHTELQKLRNYVLQRKVGYESLQNRPATFDDIASFVEEARFALWPEAAKKSARNEISSGIRRQKGGVGLRPGKARDLSPPEQGDEPAKAAIGDFLSGAGLEPWARRR